MVELVAEPLAQLPVLMDTGCPAPGSARSNVLSQSAYGDGTSDEVDTMVSDEFSFLYAGNDDGMIVGASGGSSGNPRLSLQW